jgi:Dolichyl-phosphate-mannose-protein mannosyltransferase
MIPLAVLASVVLVCVALGRRIQISAGELDRIDRLSRLLDARRTPLVLGIANALLLWWWMGWYPDLAPVIQDEAAYLLQAEIFARGRWTAAGRPLPEFFAQMHVFTTPYLAAKYPPGFSLFLTPFVWLGFTALGPMILAATTGALIFALARRITNGPVALLTWLFWSSGSALLRYQGTFLSQTLTTPLWLATFYFLLEYRTRRGTWHIVSLGACLGMMAITRPVTAVALAIPVGIVLLRDVSYTRAWRPFALATLTAIALVSLLPLQNQRTTGDWRLSPLVAYSKTYAPFDLPGFGYDSTQKLAALPPDLHATREYLTEARRQHTLPALPTILAQRARFALLDIFLGWRTPLALFAILGLLAMPLPGLFAIGASVALLVAYAFHAHWANWPVYYFEGYAAVTFASAVGLWAFAESIVRRRFLLGRLPTGTITDPRIRTAIVGFCALLLLPASLALPHYRAGWQHNITYQRRLITALSIIEDVSPRSIVFIDYGHSHVPDLSLVWNAPDLESAKTWLAYHRGSDNIRLMRLAPERRAFIFSADEARITPLPPLAQLEKTVATRTK